MEASIPPIQRTSRAAYRRIADSLRNEIVEGVLSPGSRIPSTEELSKTWQASQFTVYTALQSLVKEGWIERTRGNGSFVSDPENRFTCAGIYHSTDIFAGEEMAFSRRLHLSLLKDLAEMDKRTEIFIDSRPADQQATVLPTLANAILHRRIQCVIAPTIGRGNVEPLSHLTMPVAAISNSVKISHADFDMKGLLQESVRRLSVQGCSTVGLISHIPEQLDDGGFHGAFYSTFRRAVTKERLTTREEWIRKPNDRNPHFELHGYREFGNLWKSKEKPDGVIIYPDIVVRGAVIAILELGANSGPHPMKFVFHRNARAELVCPFPVTWAISDGDELAQALLHLIKRQFKGEKTSPVIIPYGFQRD